MRRLLPFLIASCGLPAPTHAPLIAELENEGPVGNYALVAVGWMDAEDGGLEQTPTAPPLGPAKISLVSGYLATGQVVGRELFAPIGAAVPLELWLTGPFVGEATGDGGCRTLRTVPPEGLRVRALQRSDPDAGEVRDGRACEFSFSAPAVAAP